MLQQYRKHCANDNHIFAGEVKQVNLDAVPPAELQQIRHTLAPGVLLPCDSCRNQIVGPRIQCVNCASLNQCLRCSMVDSGHDQRHICRVIFENENGAQVGQDVDIFDV